ncbi:PH domain-containing protein [Cryobacterium sp. Y62]|uniref:PH domain-containing protein n=1 Tax=Cryobacterium sp. Y62 TaxID=2048284 RepID=UPI000CE375A9|nr:PH domain-containing protein [Cryobacterium sp. Y62]
MTDTPTNADIWTATGKPLTGIGAGRYRLTSEFLYFEKGLLSLKAEQIHCHEIHDVDARQTLTQKARSVGTITLKAQRVSGAEIVTIEDIPNFREGVSAINEAANRSREALRVREQTQNVNYAGARPDAAPASGVDVNVELGKLAAFRDQGVLSEEEFVAGKKKLLGL